VLDPPVDHAVIVPTGGPFGRRVVTSTALEDIGHRDRGGTKSLPPWWCPIGGLRVAWLRAETKFPLRGSNGYRRSQQRRRPPLVLAGSKGGQP
jgi:hypothetical protein